VDYDLALVKDILQAVSWTRWPPYIPSNIFMIIWDWETLWMVLEKNSKLSCRSLLRNVASRVPQLLAHLQLHLGITPVLPGSGVKRLGCPNFL